MSLLELPRYNLRSAPNFRFLLFYGNHGGLNTYQSPDQIFQGGGADSYLESPDLMNVYSWPQGSITSFPGHANINSSAITETSVAKAITGMAYLGEIAAAMVLTAGTKFYEDVTGTPTDRTGALTITDSQDNLTDHAIITNIAIFTNRSRNAPWKWTGSGNGAALGGTPPVGKYCAAFKRRAFIFNTSANPEYGYYSAIDNAESWDTTDDVINFETKDGSVVTSATEVGESLYVGKEGPSASAGHLYRVYATGGFPVFSLEEVPTGGVGPVSQQGTIATPLGDLVFPGKNSFYMLRGNSFYDIGKPLRKYISDSVTASRLQFCSAGLIRSRGLVGFSITTTGSGHNRVLWYDYLNSRPGERDIWYLTSHAINAFTERVSSGNIQPITAGYDGYYELQLSGNSYAGAAYDKYRVTSWHHCGDPYSVKLFGVLYLICDSSVANPITVQYRTDFNTGWSPAETVTPAPGSATLGSFVLGTDVLGGKEADEKVVRIWKQARRIQFRFLNSTVSEPFNIFAYGLRYQPLPRRNFV